MKIEWRFRNRGNNNDDLKLGEQEIPQSSWEEERVFLGGDDFFEALITRLQSAAKMIDLETYIYKNDGIGKKITQELIAASKRGVKVRLLLDGIGTPLWQTSIVPEFTQSSVQVRVHRPIYFFKLLSKYLNITNTSLIFGITSALNVRNHRKVCVIDNDTAFVGSMNIAEEHLHEFAPNLAWRDTGVLVKGEEVKFLTFAFGHAWYKSNLDHTSTQFLNQELNQKLNQEEDEIPRQHLPAASAIHLNYTRILRKKFNQEFFGRIASATKRVWLTTPYFVPNLPLLKALKTASFRGVDVKILVPSKSDIKFVRWLSMVYYRKLINQDIKIYEYQLRVLHAKTYLIDDFVYVGSKNLNHRSFLHDFEVDIVLFQESSRKKIEAQFGEDLKNSKQVDHDFLKKQSWTIGILGRILFYIRHWI
ncbi:MAG: hypothetical protein HQK50_02090 [Oligoflexia bacterium]|nr:hypothetical protein [Oligoflexia bacterium]MBF0364329.1 hypothetical protein [Oligoflexia bacterium]